MFSSIFGSSVESTSESSSDTFSSIFGLYKTTPDVPFRLSSISNDESSHKLMMSKSESNAQSSLEYAINHVFFVLYHPQHDDYTDKNAHALTCAVHAAAQDYIEYIDRGHTHHWLHIMEMLENLQVIVGHIQSRNKNWQKTLEERRKLYQDAIWQLTRMKSGEYPTERRTNAFVEQITTTRIGNSLFTAFLPQLANSLSGTSAVSPIDVLRRAGGINECKRIIKCVGPTRLIQHTRSRDDDDLSQWSRTNLWFLIRVAIQSSLYHSPPGRDTYKAFVLFFMCNLADYAVNTRHLSSLLLHSMLCKILRRSKKIGRFIPRRLSETVSRTCSRLSQILDERWLEAQTLRCSSDSSSSWNPSQLCPTQDIWSSLPHIHQYISNTLLNSGNSPVDISSLPKGRLRYNLNDLLSNPDILLFRSGEPSDHSDIYVILYDAERAVAEDIDDWVAGVTDIVEACGQLECLVDRYHSLALDTCRHLWYTYNPEHLSVIVLTIIELWVALDKLVIQEIPTLADYSPEIPLNFLCTLLLRDTGNVNRLFRLCQYLVARHTRAHHQWSAFSNKFTEDSFPCRYYDISPYLQRLKADIENTVTLPVEPLHAKVVVFELQCPTVFDIWRSVTCLMSHSGVARTWDTGLKVVEVRLIPKLKPHTQSSHSRALSLYSGCSAPRCWDGLHYAYHGFSLHNFDYEYKLPSGPYAASGLQRYLEDTAHTSNEVLVAQTGCDVNLSLQEFLAFAHLRSGGSLQWFNILRELRGRTLDFRRQEVYILFVQTSTQVGPLDGTGQLSWHQELQNPSFCHAFLDELEHLLLDLGVGSSDGVAMAIISLLAGILVSAPFRDISEKAIELLRSVRRTTFDWVRNLLYDVMKSPANEKGVALLRDIAAVCRSTFDAVSVMSHKVLCSAQDVEIALSCAMLIHVTGTSASSELSMSSEILLDRDRRLSLVLEGYLKDIIQAEASNIGVDRAVQIVWPGYRPSPLRWKPLQPPHSRWLVCKTAPTRDLFVQTVHINLLDGSLLVGGKAMGSKLPNDITSDPAYCELFGERNLLVVASDLPGMDFVTISMVHRHYVHFAVRHDDHASRFWKSKRVFIRAQRKDTNNIFELIPRGILQEDLPRSLVEGYVHWLNLASSTIEIRPINEPWEQSSNNWSIDLLSGQSRVVKGGVFLVDKHSLTWEMLSSRLRCLDSPENLIITMSPINTAESSSLRLSVSLSRYDLSFFVNKDDNLESLDFKDMIYDEDQFIGSLFGLDSKLVLRPRVQLEIDLIPKQVLIPHGEILHQHDCISVVLPSSGPIRYFTYEVDNELGCLKGIVSLESRLYLAHLHALTGSGCRPEPLTGRTGVEEAISLVCLAGTRLQNCAWDGVLPWSPQMHFALKKLHGSSEPKSEFPSGCALRQEARLFPSEVAANVQPLDQLLRERPVPDLWPRNKLPWYGSTWHGFPSPNIEPLRQLFSSLRTNESEPAFQSQYISRLHDSAHHFQAKEGFNHTTHQSSRDMPSTKTLRQHYMHCRANYKESLEVVKTALRPKTQFEQILNQCDQWPRITPFILFRCLASTSPVKLSPSWKMCLISLALLALDVQRARRLLLFSLATLEEDFFNELVNEGCDGWDPARHPDWLLIQLQGNFLIRRVQVDIAKEMMSPRSGKNTMMQVNMGEGKSSVIIPISAAALADGIQLVRIIVPKSLIPQTLQILTDRLSGLVNKPISHLSFSRHDMKTNVSHQYRVELLHELVSKCRDECSIIVMQPEHVLSLKLACVETQLLKNKIRTNLSETWGFEHVLHMLTGSLSDSLNEDTYVATMISGMKRWHCEPEIPQNSISHQRTVDMKCRQAGGLMLLQRFFDAHARDMLDEIDDVLRPQLQLTYALGHQHPLEGSPERWVIIQEVLGFMKRHAYLLSAPDSHTIRCDGCAPGSFPHIHLLQASVGEQLRLLIAHDVLDGRLSSLRIHSELRLRGSIREFILRKDVHPDTVKVVEQYGRQSASWGSLLLLRGLLSHNILLFALTQRRWRVDYGLDPTFPPRTLLAIPYRAKDMPAETAEFGHPDITILLTCLCYYYNGLSEEQLRVSFELLLQQDDPFSEYTLWLGDCGTADVPNHLRQLTGLNIRSSEQWAKHLVPLFARHKRVIDLYLSKVVFSSQAKEFPRRLTGSYWDIAEQKGYLVTGFSGTNDGQYLLPTSIVQDDPAHLHQAGVNARVLAYLLQPENSHYMVMKDKKGEQWTTLKFLEVVTTQGPKIRVLLDVGAQILDLSNLQLAKAWLDCTPASETDGAIYFGEDNKLMALARNGIAQPFSSSPLSQRLHRCVVYLDDAHTRGTDLKLPLDFRAAVTLGPKVTKDRLVQGCMRMRKLGHGHSIMFFAPHAVDKKIRGLISKENQEIPVTTANVLHWAVHETWSDIQQKAPQWAQQGMNHQSRYEAWSRFCRDKATPIQLADAWVQPELKSLADMYMPCHSPDSTSLTKLSRQILERCENLGVLSLRDVNMDEELEREVSREIERQREVGLKPPRASPATHSLHPDVITFVRTGLIPPLSSSTAFRHVFTTDVSAASSGLRAWSPSVLATADFCETIEERESAQGRANDYLRPVQWVLSAKSDGRDTLVLISSFEANHLIPKIRLSERVHLHLYVPRTSKRIQPSDDLKLYSVPAVPANWAPPWALIDQLNLFAGQLFLKDHTSYVRLCRFLGLHTEAQAQKALAMRDWFSNPDLSYADIKDGFEGTKIPLAVLLLAIRRGMDFGGTHVGRIFEGWPLSEEDFQSQFEPTLAKYKSSEEQPGILVESIFIDERDGKALPASMIRKRESDLDAEFAGRPLKRRRRY